MPWRATSGVAALAGCLALLLLAAGCIGPKVYRYTPERLRAEAQSRAPDLMPEEIVVPFELDRAHVDRVRDMMPRLADEESTVTSLVEALSDPGKLGLRYDWARTADAETTIALGRGNCMSLASVLIGLARGLGIRAYYAEAMRNTELPPDSEMRVWSGHMTALIVINGQRAFVDFSGQLPPDARYRRIDDLRALSHFYNNLGFQQMREARLARVDVPWQEVRRHFETATRLDPSFGQAWNNLGVALARMGDLEAALVMYETALEVDPRLQAARQNLANLRARMAMVGAAGDESEAPSQ